jgi:hypothetical protein
MAAEDLDATIDLDDSVTLLSTPGATPLRTEDTDPFDSTVDIDAMDSPMPREPRTTLLTKTEMLVEDMKASGDAEDSDDGDVDLSAAEKDKKRRKPVKNIHDDVAEWIQEYFQFQGYSTTLDCFQAEFLSKKYSVDVTNATDGANEVGIADNRQRKIHKILRYFDEGNASSFVHEWNSNVPLHVRESETSARVALYMAQVYFVVKEMREQTSLAKSGKLLSPRSTKRPNVPTSPSRRQLRSPALQIALDRFRSYLEDEGGDVTAIQPSLGKYHALMYVTNPSRSVEFEDVFGSNADMWVGNIRKSCKDILENVMENVPTPRLLQMYESFMTSYTGFTEQLTKQQEMTMEMNRLSRRLFQLSVKIARDAGAGLPENAHLKSSQNAEKIDSDYMFRVRKMLRECREDLKMATDRRKKSTPKDLNSTFEKKLPPFLMGQPPPLDFNKVRQGMAKAGSGESAIHLQDALWWRLAYSTPPAMGPVISKEKFAALQSQMRHHVARDVLDGDVFWILSRDEDRSPEELLRDALSLHETSTPLEYDEHAKSRAATIRIIDALVTWKEGREYFKRLNSDNPCMIVEMLAREVLPQEGIPTLSEGSSSDIIRSRRVTRRHTMSALLKLSITPPARLIMLENGVLLHVAKTISSALGAGGGNDLNSGVIRHGCALVLNLLSEQKAFDTLAEDTTMMDAVATMCCLAMEQKAPKGKLGDRCGRRYASAALFGLFSNQAIRDHCRSSIEPRLRTLIQRHALVRSDRFFTHELESTLNRLETTNGVANYPLPKPPPEMPKVEHDRDFESDDEDFLGNLADTEATPVQTAISRSEMTLRSSDYSFKQKTVPGDNTAVRSILDAVEDDTEEAAIDMENIRNDPIE